MRAYLAAQRTAEVTPTVTALRRRAADVVDAELLRLDDRLPDLDERSREEVAQTVRRVVDKLLHTPTVQVKRLAQCPGRRQLRRGAARAVRARPADARGAGRPESNTRTASVEPGDEVDQALAVDTRGPGGRR